MIPKFRAWDLLRRNMSNVERLYFDTKGVQLRDDFSQYWRSSRDIVLMQSTGLCDKNGKEIFEGDILVPDEESEALAVVVFDEQATYQTKQPILGFMLKAGDMYFSLSQYIIYQAAVVGNIYENPELLEPNP